jgi:hypothetical protein
MDNPLGMNKLNNVDHLDSQPSHSHHTELLIALIMKGVDRRTQNIHHHEILTKLAPVVVNLRQPNFLDIPLLHQPHVNLALLKQSLLLQVNIFELDGNPLLVHRVIS